MSVTVKGLAGIRRGIGRVSQQYKAAVGGALYLQGSRIMAESVKQVPVDTGRLRASQFVSSPKDGPQGLTVQLGYGTDYAVPVHERKDLEHVVGNYKFLRIPFDDSKSNAARNIASDTARLFSEGKGFGNISHPFPTKPKSKGKSKGGKSKGGRTSDPR